MKTDEWRLLAALVFALCTGVGSGLQAKDRETPAGTPPDTLLGGRFFTFISYIRVNQIEVARDRNVGRDESDRHTLAALRSVRDNFGRAFPGGRMTWAFSWLALQDQRTNYVAIRQQVREYHERFGDEVTFLPGGYFAPMHNTREQVNRDLHDGLKLVGELVGGGYRPQSVVAGFLSAENLRYLAEEENIHVCQATIWSQYGIDNGDGDGSISYPYYPSREHICKPGQNTNDLIDVVCLDGWTCDFLAARRFGYVGGFNSRMGLGPLETLRKFGNEIGIRQQVFTTGLHFDDGYQRNGFGWVTAIWEVALNPAFFDSLPSFGAEVRRRWPGARAVTVGEFGGLFRRQFSDNRKLDYRFVERGSGIGGSDTNLEIRWFMNQGFRLALLHDWTKPADPERVIDFTRYDLPAAEPQGTNSRNWSLLGTINQKQRRPQDKPVPLSELPPADQSFIRSRVPELFPPK